MEMLFCSILGYIFLLGSIFSAVEVAWNETNRGSWVGTTIVLLLAEMLFSAAVCELEKKGK